MSANKKDIEKLFASKFEDYRHDFDMDSAWEAVSMELEEKKKKRRFFWWFWPIGALAIVAISFFLIQQTNNNNKLAEAETQSTNVQENPKQLFDDRTESMNASPSNAFRSQAENTLNSSTQAPMTPREKKDIVLSETPPTGFKNNVTPAKQQSNIQHNKKLEKQTQNKRAYEVTQRSGLNLIKSPPASQQLQSDMLTLKQQEINKKNNESKAFNSQNALSGFKTDAQSIGAIKLKEQQNVVDGLSLLPIQLFSLLDLTIEANHVDKKIIDLDEKINKRSFFIDVYGGGHASIIKTDLNNVSDASNVNYLNRWNQTQSAMGGYQVGLKIGKNIWKRFELSTGIHFQKTINKIEWRENTTSIHRVVWDDEAFFSIDDQGVRTTSGGRVIETEVRYRIVKAKQTHNYINIPIQLGYTTLLNKYSIGIHAGPVINLSHVFQGRVLDENSEIHILTTNNYEEVYRTSVGWSGQADLRIGRSLGNTVELFSSLSYQYTRRNAFKNDFPLHFKNDILMLNVGIRKQL